MKFNNAYSQMFPGYPDAVSLQQAAEMLGLNRHTVGELIRSRRLFALKIGRTYRIPKLSVIEFLPVSYTHLDVYKRQAGMLHSGQPVEFLPAGQRSPGSGVLPRRQHSAASCRR